MTREETIQLLKELGLLQTKLDSNTNIYNTIIGDRGRNVANQSLDNKQDTLVSGTNIKTINGNSLLGSGNLSVGSISVISAVLDVDFTNEQDEVITVVPNANLTNTNFKGFSYFPIETTATSLDDFKLNGVIFTLESIINNTSFTIRATALNNASGVYRIDYTILY
jgi:hypothetical protein